MLPSQILETTLTRQSILGTLPLILGTLSLVLDTLSLVLGTLSLVLVFLSSTSCGWGKL